MSALAHDADPGRTVCRFKIRKSADPDEFEKSIAAAVSLQKKAGSTRSGRLSGYGSCAATPRRRSGRTCSSSRGACRSPPESLTPSGRRARERSPRTPTTRCEGGSPSRTPQSRVVCSAGRFPLDANHVSARVAESREGRRYSCRVSHGGSVALVEEADEPATAVDFAASTAVTVIRQGRVAGA